jgi:hypothetical protein
LENVDLSYKLFVPSGYPTSFLRISGRVGEAPDTNIVSANIRCYRRRLPSFLSELNFEFYMPEHIHDVPIRIPNFIHLNEFFLVDDKMKSIFSLACKDVESLRIYPTRSDGAPVTQDFWAFKILDVVDCIDAAHSSAGYPSQTSFEKRKISIELSEALAHEYANCDSQYVTYPTGLIKEIAINYKAIPKNALIFEPKFLPGHYLIAEGFADYLKTQFSGGALGYYAWTLDLSNVSDSHMKLMQALR